MKKNLEHHRSTIVQALVGLTVVAYIVVIAMISRDFRGLAKEHATWAWLILLALLTLLAALVGSATKEVWVKGLLIDSASNRVALAKFQVLLWTLLLVGGIPAAVAMNYARKQKDPWSISIPSELLVATGLAVAALAGSAAVKQQAQKKTPLAEKMQWSKRWLPSSDVPAEGDKTVDLGSVPFSLTPELRSQVENVQWFAPSGAKVQQTRTTDSSDQSFAPRSLPADDVEYVAAGTLTRRTDQRTASWWDLFTSDVAPDLGQVEIARFQAVLVTITVVALYAVSFASGLDAENTKVAFPDTGGTWLPGLLGISNVFYVGEKYQAHQEAAEK